VPSTNLYYRSTYHLYPNGIYFGGPAAGKSYSVLLLFLLLHYFVLSMLYAFPAFAGSFFSLCHVVQPFLAYIEVGGYVVFM